MEPLTQMTKNLLPNLYLDGMANLAHGDIANSAQN